MFLWENTFLFSLLLVAVAIYLVLYAVFKHASLGSAIVLTIVGLVFFPMLVQTASLLPFFAILIGATLIIQQVYKGSITESLALAIIAVFAGSYLYPFVGG